MTRHTRGIAAAIAGLVSLSLVGVALANEPEDPGLDGEPTEVACPDPGTDDGTTDDGTTDDGTTDDGATDEGTTDDGTTDDGATDEGTTDDGTTDDGAEAEPCEGSTDGTEGTDGTDGTEELEATEDADVEDGERRQNHGWYVSEATKTCPESGRERGECISEVAKSDLGKPHADEPEGEVDASVEGTDDDSTGQSAKAAKAPKSSKGGGGGKGRGGKG